MQPLWIKKIQQRQSKVEKEEKTKGATVFCANKEQKYSTWIDTAAANSVVGCHRHQRHTRFHRRRDCAADDGVTEGAREPATETEMPLSDELTDGRRTPALAAPPLPLPIALALPEAGVR